MDTVIQLFVLALVLGSVYSLFAVSLNVVWGISSVVNIAHGAFLVVGAYALWSAQFWAIPILLSVIVILVVSFLVFPLLYRLLLRALGEQNIEFGSLLVTWGVSLMIVATLRAVFGTDLRKVDLLSGSVEVGGVTITLSGAVTFLIALALAAGTGAYLKFSRRGRAMRAVGSHPALAAAVGIDVPQTRAFAFGLGMTMAIGAGMLFGTNYVFFPTIGDAFIIKAVAIVLVAGLGRLWLTWIVGMALALGETVAQFVWSATGAQLLAYLLLVVALLLRKNDIARLVRRVRRRTPPPGAVLADAAGGSYSPGKVAA